MSQEGAPKHSLGPTPEEQERIRHAYREADPTTYSAVAREKPGDAGEYFVRIEENPQGQQIVARLLKGILNVSDVVSVQAEKGLETYSKILPHEKIEQETSIDEIRAGIELLHLVFGDFDHMITGPVSDDREHLNLRTEKKRTSFFDFGRARPAKLVYHFNAPQTPESLAVLDQKLTELKERLSGQEGNAFVRAVIGTASLPDVFGDAGMNQNADTFQVGLLHKIALAKSFVQNERQMFERQEAA